MNAIVRLDGGASYPRALGMVRTVSWELASQINQLCAAGATIDQALVRLQTGLSFDRPQDADWWTKSINWIRAQLASANLGVCTYTANALLEQDVFATVAARAGRGWPRGVGFDPNGQAGLGFDPNNIPPLPPMHRPDPECDDDDDDDDEPEYGGGSSECGPGCCGGGCADCGGCGWTNVKLPGPGESPCIFDRRPMKRIDLRNACAQLGRLNCEPVANDVAPCDIERIVRQTKRWFLTASNAAGGGLVVVTADAAHEVPVGFTLYAATILGIPLSHKLCLRRLDVTATVAGEPVVVEPTLVGLEASKLYCSAEGGYVHAWDFPEYEEEEYIRITDGRCECARLCICVPQGEPARVLFLIPTPLAGTVISISASGKRECYGIMCGDCPPGRLCGRTLVDLDPTPG